MRVRLVLILFVLLCVNGFEANVGKSKFVGFESKLLENDGLINNVNKIPSNNVDEISGPFCNSITAFYIGTLQNKRSNKTYDIEFQVKLWADSNKKKIYVQGTQNFKSSDKWNEKYSKSENFELDYYFGENRDWCDIYDDECVSPFAKKETSFKLDLNTADGNYFHLLNFNFFNNSFGLTDPIGKCTKHQLDGLNDDYTPNNLFDKLSFCVCCGDYKPDELMNCPFDNLGEQKPTPEPTKPQPRDISCKEIVAYFNGLFQNKIQAKYIVDIEFQLRLVANDVNRRISFIIDQWNENKATSSDFVSLADGFYGNPWTYCSPINSRECTVNFTTKQNLAFNSAIDYHQKGEYTAGFRYLTFPNFNNSFTLTNAIGQCTKNQYFVQDDWNPNPKLFEYCVCCGSEYKPDPALGCPKNPWA